MKVENLITFLSDVEINRLEISKISDKSILFIFNEVPKLRKFNSICGRPNYNAIQNYETEHKLFLENYDRRRI